MKVLVLCCLMTAAAHSERLSWVRVADEILELAPRLPVPLPFTWQLQQEGVGFPTRILAAGSLHDGRVAWLIPGELRIGSVQKGKQTAFQVDKRIQEKASRAQVRSLYPVGTVLPQKERVLFRSSDFAQETEVALDDYRAAPVGDDVFHSCEKLPIKIRPGRPFFLLPQVLLENLGVETKEGGPQVLAIKCIHYKNAEGQEMAVIGASTTSGLYLYRQQKDCEKIGCESLERFHLPMAGAAFDMADVDGDGELEVFTSASVQLHGGSPGDQLSVFRWGQSVPHFQSNIVGGIEVVFTVRRKSHWEVYFVERAKERRVWRIQ